MQVIEGSVIYRLIIKLFGYYEHSMLRKFPSVFVMCCKNSHTAAILRRCKVFYQNSLILQWIGRLFRRFYKLIDRLVLLLSDLFQKWDDGSLLCGLFSFIGRASKERIFVLAAPVFGVGYFAGRLILNRLMIRDILFLSVTFFAAAVLLVDKEKLKAYFRNSLFYKLYLLVLE